MIAPNFFEDDKEQCIYFIAKLIIPYVHFMIIVEEDNVYLTISFMSNVRISTRQ